MKNTDETIITVDHCVYIEPGKGRNERKLEIFATQEIKNIAMVQMIKGMISDYGTDTKVSKDINSFTYHSIASHGIVAHLDCDTINNEASKKFLVGVYDIEIANYIFSEIDKISKNP